jgi:hypothetical protein
MGRPEVFRVVRKNGMLGKAAVIILALSMFERRQHCYSTVIRCAPLVHKLSPVDTTAITLLTIDSTIFVTHLIRLAEE